MTFARRRAKIINAAIKNVQHEPTTFSHLF